MSERIHDDELDTSELTVRGLLEAQCPEWSKLALSSMRSSGTSNALWRVGVSTGSDLIVRLPGRPKTDDSIRQELELLPLIADSPLARVVRTPMVRHAGEPTEAFPHPWAVFEWLDGTDAWTARDELEPALNDLAIELAQIVNVINELRGLPAPRRQPGSRGGPLEPLLRRLDEWLDDPQWNAPEVLDVSAVKRRAAETAAASEAPVTTGFVHGDLIPGNLLVSGGQLSAILDWGSAGYGDIALDLTPAWAVLDEPSRSKFRDQLDVDEPTWLRGRAFALEQAVAGVLYYTPRRHPLGDVMARTLTRILEEG